VSAPAITPRTPDAPEADAPDPGAGPRRALSRWLWAGTLGTAAAGGLHVAAGYEHLGAGDLAVGFFLVAALAQLGLAAWLAIHAVTGLRPDRRLLTLALTGTVALLGLYVVAHTTSLLDAFAVPHDAGADGHGSAHDASGHTPGIDPVTGVDYSTGVAVRSGPVAMFGETAPARHAPGALGPWTAAAEVLTVAALAALQPATWRRHTVNALMAIGALVWVLWLTGVLA
jgi:hypothetical protein